MTRKDAVRGGLAVGTSLLIGLGVGFLGVFGRFGWIRLGALVGLAALAGLTFAVVVYNLESWRARRRESRAKHSNGSPRPSV